MKNNRDCSVYWYSLRDPKPNKNLVGTVKTKVAIIGGGMAGLSAAQRLLESGLEVVILERDFCGAGASGKTSGFITPDSEIELSSLLENYGQEKAKNIWEFVLSGVKNIRQNIENYSISCDFQVQDSLFVANNRTGFKDVKKEYLARQELGYQSTIYNETTINKVIGSSYVGGVSYPKTFGINSYLYCQSMKDFLIKSGVKIFEKTSVEKIIDNRIITENGQLLADKIIVCTDRFIPELGSLKREIYHVQTFLGITKPLTNEQIKSIFPGDKMMVWDTDLIYNYFRLTGDNRLLIGGGDLFYTYAKEISSNVSRFSSRLKNYINKKFPSVQIEIEYLWPGMLGVSKDLLPIIGPDKNNTNVFYVGAATGLPWASALGHYAADRIVNGRDELDKYFTLDRKFIIGKRLQSILGTPPTYAISHGIAKYF